MCELTSHHLFIAHKELSWSRQIDGSFRFSKAAFSLFKRWFWLQWYQSDHTIRGNQSEVAICELWKCCSSSFVTLNRHHCMGKKSSAVTTRVVQIRWRPNSRKRCKSDQGMWAVRGLGSWLRIRLCKDRGGEGPHRLCAHDQRFLPRH